MKIGIDVVSIARVASLDPAARSRVFHAEEMRSSTAERLAGIFALKEACKKVFGPKLAWLDILVGRREDGAPTLAVAAHPRAALECSVSHDAGVAVGVVLLAEAGP